MLEIERHHVPVSPLDPWQAQRELVTMKGALLLPQVHTIGFMSTEYPDSHSEMKKHAWAFAWKLCERDGKWQFLGYFRLDKDDVEDVLSRIPLARTYGENRPFDARASLMTFQTYTDEIKYVMTRVDYRGKTLSNPCDVSRFTLLVHLNIFKDS